jgi:hypothetical protein
VELLAITRVTRNEREIQMLKFNPKQAAQRKNPLKKNPNQSPSTQRQTQKITKGPRQQSTKKKLSST